VFGISGAEAVVLLVIAVLVVGPERLPRYAGELARMIKELRRMAAGASAQVRQELGPEFDEVEWRKLDPRQYDPRRIVREALADSIDPDDPLGLRDLPGDGHVTTGSSRRTGTGPSEPASHPVEASGSGTAATDSDDPHRPGPSFDPDST